MPQIDWGNPWVETEFEEIIDELIEKNDKNREQLVEMQSTLDALKYGFEAFRDKQGLYQLIFGSELNTAKDFRRWVFTEVLPSIRKTGSYSLPDRRSLRYNQMILVNETNLHYAVVRYLINNHRETVVIPGLGELQDTSGKRCDAWKKGYRGGQPDIIIENPKGSYKGFAI
ncbi:Hypothetical predicted protein [Paramuricea clavata]|uniref:Uncharacterized protein n=1 Tax=Paramuricea clavata TaxID=317549 RepID=A0A6S7HWA1_PARCT|nr:Hypothetical predicted protein [Paramuricea clavata]